MPTAPSCRAHDCCVPLLCWEMGLGWGLLELVGNGLLCSRKTESHLHCELKSLCCCKRSFTECKYLLASLFLTAKRLGWPELWTEQGINKGSGWRRGAECSIYPSEYAICYPSEYTFPGYLSCPRSHTPAQLLAAHPPSSKAVLAEFL